MTVTDTESTLQRWRPLAFFLCALAALLLPTVATAQQPLQIASESNHYTLSDRLEILEDPSGQLTFADVTTAPATTRFELRDEDVPNFGYTTSSYWARVRLHHAQQTPSVWWLELRRQKMNQMDLYVVANGTLVEHRQTGDTVPPGDRETAYAVPPTFAFKLTLEPQTTYTLYLRFQSDEPLYLPLYLMSPDAMVEKNMVQYIGLGFLYGIVLIMASYNLLLWVSIREPAYLYYVATLISYLLIHASSRDLLDYYVWPTAGNLSEYTDPLFAALLLLSAIRFADTLLQLDRLAPRLHRASTYLSISWVAITALTFIVPASVRVPPIVVLGLVTAGFMLLVGVVGWHRNYQPARYYLVAFTLPVVGMVVQQFARVGILPANIFTEQIVQIGMVFMVLLFALALAERINVLKQQTERAYHELQAHEHRLLQYLEAIPIGVTMIDQREWSAYTNKTGRDILGIEQQEYGPEILLSHLLDNHTLYVAGTDEPFPPENLPLFRALQGESTHTDSLEMVRGNNRIVLEVWASPIRDETGEIRFAIAAFQDITERRQTELELRTYQERLEALVADRTETLKHEIEERKRVERALRRLAMTDSLTGLFNRRHWLKRAEKEFERTRRYERALSIIICDVDHFKHVNDTFGHMVGDDVLIRVADIIEENVRSVDVVARFGGEEFVVLMPETRLEYAYEVAERLRRTVAAFRLETGDATIRVTLSVGVAQFDERHDTSLSTLIERADDALYAAKQAGRNRVERSTRIREGV